MDARQASEVARSLDADPEALPLLPELLADVDALGARPELVVELLRGVVAPGEKALDLGCGKGAVSMALASELGLRVVGVDLFPPFVAAARRRAAGAPHCRARFAPVDLRRALTSPRRYDAVVYASLDVLGAIDVAVGQMRSVTRAGGHLVLDDGYLADGAPDRDGYSSYASRDETRNRLERHGDRILREITTPPADLAAWNVRTTDRIRSRAAELARRRPELAPVLEAYVARQEEECAYLDEHFVGATWLLRRAP